MSKSDIYAISGRIKNLIAMKDLALSPAGLILVNSYTLVLKELYDFADSLPDPAGEELRNLLLQKESLPEYVISLSTPKEEAIEDNSYDQIEPQFNTNEEALEHFTKEFEALGAKYNKTGHEFWMEAENEASIWTEDHEQIMRLSRNIAMALHLIEKSLIDGE